MKYSMRIPIFLACALLIPIHSSASDDIQKVEQPDRSWVHSDVIVYGFKDGSQLFKTRFGSNEIHVLTDHHFTDGLIVWVSPDKRYVIYQGSRDKIESPYYLYDTKQGHELELPEPKGFPMSPAFSPNSDKILLWTGNQGNEDLFLYDLATAHITEIPFPEGKPLPEPYFGGFWSLDGKSLYVATTVGRDNAYYRYDIASGSYTRIDGYESHDDMIFGFKENGRKIEHEDMDGPCSNQSEAGRAGCWITKITSPNGRLVVSLNRDHKLILTGAAAQPTVVDDGGYDDCEGAYLQPDGWIDERYFVYEVHRTPYIYDIVSGKKTVLFDRRNVSDYFW